MVPSEAQRRRLEAHAAAELQFDIDAVTAAGVILHFDDDL